MNFKRALNKIPLDIKSPLDWFYWIWLILAIIFNVFYFWFDLTRGPITSGYGISRESFTTIFSILAPLGAAFVGVLIASVVIVAQHFINSIRHCRDSLADENEWLIRYLNEYEFDNVELFNSLNELSEICSISTAVSKERIDPSNIDDVMKKTLDGFNKCRGEILENRKKLEEDRTQIETKGSHEDKEKEINNKYKEQLSNLAKQMRSFKAIDRHLYRIHDLIFRLVMSITSFRMVRNLVMLTVSFGIFLIFVIILLVVNNVELPVPNKINSAVSDNISAVSDNIQVSATDNVSVISTTTTTLLSDSARLYFTVYLNVFVLVMLFIVAYDSISIVLKSMSEEVGKLKETSD